MVHAVFQGNTRQRGLCPCHAFRGAHPAVDKRLHHVLQRRGARQEVEALEHETDRAVSCDGQFVFRQAGDVAPFEEITAGGGPVETAQDVHHGRFAGTRRADESDVFVLADRQTDTVERGDGLLSHHIMFDDVLKADQFAHQCVPLVADTRSPSVSARNVL